MTTSIQVERRVGQRFPFLLPVSYRTVASGLEGVGITHDLSSRGVFFLTDARLHEGDEIELTLTMPSEITLGDNMRVRCRGHILRIVQSMDHAPKIPDDLLRTVQPPGSATAPTVEPKIAVAVRLECYEYLTDVVAASAFPRVAVLHTHRDDDRANDIPPQR
jgi:hypothetical protein